MNVIEQSAKLLYPSEGGGVALMKLVEYAGRNCYNSYKSVNETSYKTFIKNLMKNGHESPLEFANLTFELTTSRAVLAEITRHRLASFAVTSQRYIKEKGDIDFIRPEWSLADPKKDYKEALNGMLRYSVWTVDMEKAEKAYQTLIENGATPEEAREVLPNSTSCRIVMSANAREWRHFFTLRCSHRAYPQMRALAKMILIEAHKVCPDLFEDLYAQFIAESGDTDGDIKD